jgi:hypothetical protein
MRPFLLPVLRLAWLLGPAAAALVTAPVHAHAQPPAAPAAGGQGRPAAKDAGARAVAHAEKGRRFYDLRRWDQAIKEFEAAYHLDSDPAHLYNIAQAHRMASHIPQAIELYQSYLSRFPNAPNRADVERRIAELKESGRPPNTLEPQPNAGAPAAAPAAPYPGWPPQQPQAPPAGYPAQGYGPAPGYPPQAYAPPPGYTAAPLVGDPGAPASYGGNPGYGAGPGYGPAPGYPPQGPALAATALPGDHKHDGFFLRAQLGFGFFSMTDDKSDVRLRGAAGSFALALGGAISERLVLYGEVGSGVTTDPEIKNGNLGGRELDGSVSVVGFGGGAAYYLMPLNAYVSATISATQVTFEIAGEQLDSEIGGGLTLSLGKEWWLARNLGFGVAVQLHASAAKANDSSGAATLLPVWGAIAGSATFN